ncbi:MAG: hypothetical protein ACT4QC_22520 [Planctomycetaceae bacterium]
MKRVALLFCCLAMWCVSPSAAQNEKGKPPGRIDVTGTWKAEVELTGNSGAPVFTFEQDGEKITGKYQGYFGTMKVAGKVAGDQIEFKFPTDQGHAIYTGTVDKNTMKGTVKYGDALSGTWSAKREVATKAALNDVLEKYVEALGGKTAWNRVETRRINGTLTANGSTGEWALEGKAPNKQVRRAQFPGVGLIEDGFDGTTGWSRSYDGLRSKKGDELRRAEREADLQREVRIQELYPELKYKGIDRFNGEEVRILEGTPSRTSRDRFTFSTKSGLLVRQQIRFDRDGVPWEVETEFSDYRAVDGVAYPHEQKVIVLINDQPAVEYVVSVKEIRHNEKIEDSRFMKPAG